MDGWYTYTTYGARDTNEDVHAVCGTRSRWRIAAVADGFWKPNNRGVRVSAQHIARFAVETFVVQAPRRLLKNSDPKAVQYDLYAAIGVDTRQCWPGTTLATACVDTHAHRAYAAALGDSLAVHYRSGVCSILPKDLTYVGKNLKGAFGDCANEHHITPDIATWELAKGDILLLCSDGLYASEDAAEIVARTEDLLQKAQMLRTNPAHASRFLAEHALGSYGSADNITVALLYC